MSSPSNLPQQVMDLYHRLSVAAGEINEIAVDAEQWQIDATAAAEIALARTVLESAFTAMDKRRAALVQNYVGRALVSIGLATDPQANGYARLCAFVALETLYFSIMAHSLVKTRRDVMVGARDKFPRPARADEIKAAVEAAVRVAWRS